MKYYIDYSALQWRHNTASHKTSDTLLALEVIGTANSTKLGISARNAIRLLTILAGSTQQKNLNRA